MKKAFLFLSFALGALLSQSQKPQADSWTITWNKKTLLKAESENEADNSVKINTADLGKKKYCLEISYQEATADREKNWNRTILFFDNNDKELLRKENTRKVKLTAAQLKDLFGSNKEIKIYTMAIPSDPDLAARIRVRRVHLCTLALQ